MTWERLLTFVFWISPHVLLAIVACLMYQRKLYREFPFFLLYTLYEIAEFIFLYALDSIRGVTGPQYTYAFVGTLIVSIALRFGVIKELSENLFQDHEFIRLTAARGLRWATAILILVGVASAVYAPGGEGIKLIGGLTVISRGVAIIQCGLLLYLLCFSNLLGLSWRAYAFGVALGLGILSAVDLATTALRVYLADIAWGRTLNLVTTGSYLICALVWLGYLLAPL